MTQAAQPIQQAETPTRAPGDLYIIANDVIEPVDFRAGIRGVGRILHCASDFTVKNEIRLDAQGVLIGLALDPRTGRLYATSPQRHLVTSFDAQDREVPAPSLPDRRYGNIIFDPAGRGLVGIHSVHGGPAPDDGYGEGKLVRFDPASGAVEVFEVEIDGGRGGKHCISSLALAADGRTLFYASEAGRRLMRFDVEAGEQLPDFRVFTDDEGIGTYGLSALPDGGVLMATSAGAARFDADGKEVQRFDGGEDHGWTRAKLSADGRHFYLGNFLKGVLEKRELDSGEIVDRLVIGKKGSLTGVVEIPAETGA